MKPLIFATGTISAVDTKNCRARVRLPDHDNLRSYWLDVLHRNTLKNRDYNLPDVGEQVKVLMTPDAQEGVILGAVYSVKDKPVMDDQDIRRIDFGDDAYVEYNRKDSAMTIAGEIKTLTVLTHDVIRVETDTEIHLKAKSDITVDTDKTLTVTAASNVKLATQASATLESAGSTLLKSSGTTIDAPATKITGTANVGGSLTVAGGSQTTMTGSAAISNVLTVGSSITAGGVVAAAGFTSSGGGAPMQMTGDISHRGSQQSTGNIRAGGDVTAGAVSLIQTDNDLKALEKRVAMLETQLKSLAERHI